MRYKEIVEDASVVPPKNKNVEIEQLRRLAVKKGYVLNGVGGSPETLIAMLSEPSADSIVIGKVGTEENRMRLRAWLESNGDDN